MEHHRFHNGFTLVELMVVLTIIVTISMVVITSQSSFNKTFILANTAYDIALTLRSAATYGLGSRALGTTVNVGYGLHFQNSTPGSFTFFADTSPPAPCDMPSCKSGNNVYTSGNDAFVQTYTLGNGMTISDFCVDGLCTYNSLDIVFSRPDSDAHISANGSYSPSYSRACITVTAPQGGERHVSVSKSGQINANATSCP